MKIKIVIDLDLSLLFYLILCLVLKQIKDDIIEIDSDSFHDRDTQVIGTGAEWI